MLLFKDWYGKLLSEISSSERVKIVSPFIKEKMVRSIESKIDFRKIEIVTRFNLKDFAMGVSSLAALRFAMEKGAKVYGVKDLHSKIYIFDSRLTIISSANLTNGGLINNHECGFCIEDKNTVDQTIRHFEDLKGIANHDLTLEECDKWREIINKIDTPTSGVYGLPDYGGGIKIDNDNRNYYVKFFGTSDNRVELDFLVREEIDRALCHYACGFSKSKPPKRINEGDVVYLARLTDNPRDYSIFGKATAVKFSPKRDRFTKQEIKAREWKEYWPIYLRIKDAVFIEGTLADCPSLFELIAALDYASFPTTQQKYDRGVKNINPKRSLAQQPYVRLTKKAAEWLEPKFQDALSRCGSVDQKFISSLPQAPIKSLA